MVNNVSELLDSSSFCLYIFGLSFSLTVHSIINFRVDIIINLARIEDSDARVVSTAFLHIVVAFIRFGHYLSLSSSYCLINIGPLLVTSSFGKVAHWFFVWL